MENKLLSVITVTYNNKDNILEYLQSIEKNLPRNSEIIIIDNASNDSTAKILEKKKNIVFIKSGTNLGFAKACNLAAQKANGEYLFFLNPDTKVFDRSIQKLLDFYEKTPDAGIVAPKIFQDDHHIQPSVRKFPSVFGAIREYYLGVKNVFDAYIPDSEDPIAVETVVGAAMLIRKDLFEKIGGFDEKYFMYYEDIDLCKKVHNLGLKVYYVPDSAIYHKVGGSVSNQKSEWIKQSARKYHGVLGEFLLYLVLRFRNIFNNPN